MHVLTRNWTLVVLTFPTGRGRARGDRDSRNLQAEQQPRDDLDARQHQQSQKWQAEQQPGKNHKNDPHGPEMEALSNGRNQKHGGQENRDAYVLVTPSLRILYLVP